MKFLNVEKYLYLSISFIDNFYCFTVLNCIHINWKVYFIIVEMIYLISVMNVYIFGFK